MAFKKKRKGAQIFLTIVLILGIVIFGFYAYNQVALKQEAKLIIPIGQMIDLGEYRLHIYAEGEASEKPTLVFMSGSATVAPTYDFKILYDLLSDEYHIVVVEKAGYGYSDIIDIQRDIDRFSRWRILEEHWNWREKQGRLYWCRTRCLAWKRYIGHNNTQMKLRRLLGWICQRPIAMKLLINPE